jgi:phospholipid-binding lipoprotein MlaA
MRDRCRLLLVALGAAWLLTLTGCATVPKDPVGYATYKANNDPLEPLNRKTFAFNQGVDKVVLRPLAESYVHVVPSRMRDGIRNILKNLNEPLVFANNVLQFKFRHAGTTASRFVLNTTVGVFGIWDFAGRHGMPRQIGDFGQTLYVWHVGSGPYLVLPVFGPTTPRDGIGKGIDIWLDPLFWITDHLRYRGTFDTVRVVVSGIDERAQNLDVLDELKRESVDFYAAMRSLWRQNREAQLHDGVLPPPAPGPVKVDDLYADPGADPGSSTGGTPQSDMYKDPAEPPTPK